MQEPELLFRIEHLMGRYEGTVGERVRPLVKAWRRREWELARRRAVAFLASTPTNDEPERLFEHRLQQLPQAASSDDMMVDVDAVTKLRVYVRLLVRALDLKARA